MFNNVNDNWIPDVNDNWIPDDENLCKGTRFCVCTLETFFCSYVGDKDFFKYIGYTVNEEFLKC